MTRAPSLRFERELMRRHEVTWLAAVDEPRTSVFWNTITRSRRLPTPGRSSSPPRTMMVPACPAKVCMST